MKYRINISTHTDLLECLFYINNCPYIGRVNFLQDVLNGSSSRDLNTLFDQRKITLYMASNYARFKNNVLGVGWDSAAIMHQSRGYKMMSFPKVRSLMRNSAL